MPVDRAMALAAWLAYVDPDELSGPHLVSTALAAAEPGNAGWLLPINPQLHIQRNQRRWEAALKTLYERTFVLAKV